MAKRRLLPISEILKSLEEKAPSVTAETWDNVGLLVGDPSWKTGSAIVSVDLTREAVETARRRGAGLIVNHHPSIFKPLKRVAPGCPDQLQTLLFECIRAGIAVYASHTNFDRCALEVPYRICEDLGVKPVGRLVEHPDPTHRIEGLTSGIGYGFYGDFPDILSFSQVAQRVKSLFRLSGYWITDPPPKRIRRIGFVAGKGASFADTALSVGCDLFITGEAGYHVALDASRRGMGLMELGHRESELFFLKVMRDWLASIGLSATSLDRPTQKVHSSLPPKSQSIGVRK